MLVQDGKSINTILTILDIDSRYAHSCIGLSLFQAIGLSGYNGHEQPFSAFSKKTQSAIQYTDLDKFLVFLLYQPEFRNGQSIEQIQSTYEEIYQRSKNEFFEIPQEITNGN
jgi:hypothetical protein